MQTAKEIGRLVSHRAFNQLEFKKLIHWMLVKTSVLRFCGREAFRPMKNEKTFAKTIVS